MSDKTKKDRLREEAANRLLARLQDVGRDEQAGSNAVYHELQVHQIELEMQCDELKTAQKRIALSRDRFLCFFHQAPVGYLILTDDGRILDVNETLCNMLESQRTKILACWVHDLISAEFKDEFSLRFPSFFRDPSAKIMKSVMQSAQDRYIAVRMVASRISPPDVDAHQEQLLVAVYDITDVRKMEEEQKQLKHLLAHMGKISVVGRLASGVAHDVNNKLTVIKGFCELIPRDNSNPELTEGLVEIEKAVNHAIQLTSRLLNFSHLNALAMIPLNVNDIVESLLAMLKRLIGERIRLSWTPAADLWLVMSDRSALDQIVSNLLVNARDAIADEGDITIWTENRTVLHEAEGIKAGNYVVLTVADNGCGMSPEVVQQAQQPFFTTKDLGKGTGLGLSVVCNLAKQMNGFFDITSDEGVGTEMRLYLPQMRERMDEI